VLSKRTTLNAAGTQALFAVHHCGKNSQAELDSFTIGQLSVSRAGPSIELRPGAPQGIEVAVWMMQPGEAQIVARRIREVLKGAA